MRAKRTRTSRSQGSLIQNLEGYELLQGNAADSVVESVAEGEAVRGWYICGSLRGLARPTLAELAQFAREPAVA